MVPKEQLTRVAGINQTLKGALNIACPPLGALLLAVMPLHGIMLVDVGTAMLAILPLFLAYIPQPQRVMAGAQKPSVWTDMHEGLRYILSWPGLMALIGMAMIFKIALTPAFSLIPLLVSKHFGGGAAQLSLLDAAAGVGIVLGGIALSAWGGFRRKIYTTLLGAVVFGASFVALGAAPGNAFGMAIVSTLVAGLTVPLIDGPIMAILQGNVAPEIQGRVFTLMGSLLYVTSPLSLAVAGPVSDTLGLQVWYVAAGAACALMGLGGFLMPAIVHIEENYNGRAAAHASVPAAGNQVI
jgi:DHA3 family macrolide efflux protein-like MFS transporter